MSTVKHWPLESNCSYNTFKIPDCTWFTFQPKEKLCLALKDCDSEKLTDCDGCISGEHACNVKCWITGRCRGEQLKEVKFNY